MVYHGAPKPKFVRIFTRLTCEMRLQTLFEIGR